MNDLIKIKNNYGEKMANLCQELFHDLLNLGIDGLLYTLIRNHFDPSTLLYKDIIERDLKSQFQSYIYSLVDIDGIKRKQVENANTLFNIDGYINTKDGKMYRCNYIINGICYCSDNVIIENSEVKQEYLDKERYLVIDYFIIDLKLKKVFTYDKSISTDGFVKSLDNIDKIIIKQTESQKYIFFEINGRFATVIVDEKNRIIGYINNIVTEIESAFLYFNYTLKIIQLNNVKKIKNNFLGNNYSGLKSIELPNVEAIGNYFLWHNHSIRRVSMNKVKKIGNCFMRHNNTCEIIDFPELEEIGECFFELNRNFKKNTIK